jgi:DNA-binding transcriptional MerR regulator
MSSKLLSTVAVAKEIGVARSVLQYWIKEGIVNAPKTKLRNGVAVRLWTAADVEKARKLKGNIKRGPEPGAKGKKSKKSKI